MITTTTINTRVFLLGNSRTSKPTRSEKPALLSIACSNFCLESAHGTHHRSPAHKRHRRLWQVDPCVYSMTRRALRQMMTQEIVNLWSAVCHSQSKTEHPLDFVYRIECGTLGSSLKLSPFKSTALLNFVTQAHLLLQLPNLCNTIRQMRMCRKNLRQPYKKPPLSS